MTAKNQNIVVIAASILLICVISFLIFEIKKVPDVSWKQDYKYESEDPYGGWIFKESIIQTYGEDNVFDYSELDSLPTDSNYLYINFGPSIIVTKEKQEELDQFLDKKNDLLFIANELNTYQDTFSHFYITNYHDSITLITFNDTDSSSFNFLFYKNKISAPTKSFHSSVTEYDLLDSTHTLIGTAQDSSFVFFSKDYKRGHIFYHLNPYNFSNIASKQEDYLAHFNMVFSHFDADKIILDSPKESDVLQSEYSDSSPIQYILSQKSLAWAYYLTVLSLLIFIFFRGKRKQRIIPISKVNKNTSLEYVDTVSLLFKSQKQNRKLVEHLENIFYHKVKTKYFIDKSHSDFINLFSYKSKIKRNEVDHIIDVFKNAKDGYEFTDDQLHRLHKNLETIYINWK